VTLRAGPADDFKKSLDYALTFLGGSFGNVGATEDDKVEV
jgi:hypothetical protein